METWLMIIVSLCIATIIKSTLTHRNKLPPGPSFLYSTYLLLTNSRLQFEPILINLKSTYGPIFTLPFAFRTTIFVSTHSLTHHILIQNGAVFSDRPKSLAIINISSASYGPTWRTLRRNLATEIMHPTRVKSYSRVRNWVLRVLIERLQESQRSDGVKVVDHFQYAMFCLLVVMCFGPFGNKVDEIKVNEIAKVQRDMLIKVGSGRFAVLTGFPRLGKMLFRNRWNEFEKLRSDRDDVLIPLIESRIESVRTESGLGSEEIVAYVDTLVNLRLPEEEGGDNGNGGRLTRSEIASMCSEFLNAGTDTTSTALQWIMANLIKNPRIQSKLYDEIVAVVGPPPSPPRKGVETETIPVINEEDIQKMPHLKAVVLEGLRRHPPGHFVLPHRL